MHHQKGHVVTAEPSRILTRLCFHFSKKIGVQYDDRQGLAHFPWGDCRLTAHDSTLDFECYAATPEQLDRVTFVIDEHIALFSRKTPLAVQWAARNGHEYAVEIKQNSPPIADLPP